MQLCTSRNGDSLGSSAPLVFASPNSKQKLLLLERRLTGSGTGAPNSLQLKVLQAGATSRDIMPEDVITTPGRAAQQDPSWHQHMELDAAACPRAGQQQPEHEAATAAYKAAKRADGTAAESLKTSSGGTSGGDTAPTTSASKRRKTGKPQFRPATTENGSTVAAAVAPAAAGHQDPGGKAAAGLGGLKDLVQRDKTPKRATTKASPRAEGKGNDNTSSNPPPSPVGATAERGQGVPGRTPRSSSKQQQQQQQQQHSRGQTNINKFFPLLLDGSSRDSDTPAAIQQQQQQQVLPHMSPIEGLVEHTAAAEAVWPEAAMEAAAAAQPRAGQQQRSGSSSGANSKGGSGSVVQAPSATVAAAVQQMQQRHQQEVQQLKEAARRRESALSDQLTVQQRQAEQMSAVLQQLQQELSHARSSSEDREGAVRAALSSLVEALGVSQGQLGRLQLAMDGSRLGCLGVSRAGALGFSEVWEEGPVFRELAGRQAAVRRAREDVEAARKALKRRLPPPPRATAAAAAAAAAADVSAVIAAGGQDSSGAQQQQQQQYISSAEYVMQDEILKVRLSVLRREEELLVREEERLQQEKMRHLRSLKRLRDEESSRFCGQPTLNRRYVLLQLLGRGGFSEVHKAYDLAGLKFVAVKLHQLNSGWSEARKASYVRHAVREYTIHKALRHVNIVSLTDIFEVDNTTFATVLELCEGGDLEGYLQQHHVVPEREARALISQVFSGLAYLNRAPPNSSSSSGGCGGVGGVESGAVAAAAGVNLGPRVIHYDLKPANILFDRLGTVKITDFGLSKVVEEGQTMGMELTSQGAGTYWYLPPECFQTSSNTSAGSSRAAAGVGGLLPPGLLSGGAAGGGGAAAGGGVGGGLGGGVPASPPKISNKVDVWSAGVILYQMLYGRRPFGEGLSQEQIFRDGVMLNARQVQFPSKPAVSAEGRAFLSHCLAYNQEDRWDVLTAAADPYLQLKR